METILLDILNILNGKIDFENILNTIKNINKIPFSYFD